MRAKIVNEELKVIRKLRKLAEEPWEEEDHISVLGEPRLEDVG